MEHCALEQTCACRHILLTLQLSVSSVAMFPWPHTFSASGWLRLQRTGPFTACEGKIWGDKKGRFIPIYHRGPGVHCLCQNILKYLIKMTHSNLNISSVGTQDYFREVSSPSISISHWICSFVPLLKVPLYIPFCNNISGNCKQLDWMSEWAQWVQDSLLQTCWRPNNAPCRQTACSKRLTYSDYPEK